MIAYTFMTSCSMPEADELDYIIRNDRIGR